MADEQKYNPDGTTTIKIIKILNGTDIVCVIPQGGAAQNSPLLTLDKPLEIVCIKKLTTTIDRKINIILFLLLNFKKNPIFFTKILWN